MTLDPVSHSTMAEVEETADAAKLPGIAGTPGKNNSTHSQTLMALTLFNHEDG